MISLTSLANALSANVALNDIAAFFTGPQVAQGTEGTWFVSGTVLLSNPGVASECDVKLWDGTTVIASANVNLSGTPTIGSVALSGVITSPAGNLRISAKCIDSVLAVIAANLTGEGNDSTITAVRIA
jgi:hypothetical protein